MSEVVRLTSIPKSIGPLYRLCKACRGSGERRGPEGLPQLKDDAGKKAAPSARRNRDCPTCGGIGEVLS